MINSFFTNFEARERKPQIENAFHGETIDLVSKVSSDGVPNTLDGYTASGFYQSADDKENWYELTGEVANGQAVLHWTPEKDLGSDMYYIWLCLEKGSERSYPGYWQLSLAYSPSTPEEQTND